MGFVKQELEDQQERLDRWRYQPGFDVCPNCREQCVDPAKRFCRNCLMYESDAWAALVADPSR